MPHLTFVLAALFAVSGTATILKEVTFESMVASSTRIVTGHVTKSWTSWGSQHKFIWTRYEIAVDEVMRGPKVSTVVVSEPGGVLDGRAMSVESAVRYTPGEHVTLFLQQFPGDVLRTVGWSQGKFTIDEGNRVHSNAGSGYLPFGVQGTSIRSLDGIPYSDLLARVRKAAK